MENGLPDVRTFRSNHIQAFETLPSEIHALKISDNRKTLELPVTARNGCSFDHLPLHPSPAHRVDLNDVPSTEFKFIDECTSSSSSSSSGCSTTKRDSQNSGLGSGSTCHTSESARSPPSPVSSSIVAQVSTALSGHSPPSKRLPSAVVIGYQRAIAESIAAAGLMNQRQSGPGASSKADEYQTVKERTVLDLSEVRPNLTSGSVNKKVDCSPSGHRSDLLAPPPPPPPEESDEPTPPSSPRPEDHFETGCGAATTASNSLPVYDQHMLWELLVSRRGSTVSADDAESIAESVYHQPPKAADRAAACRLAKRLFTLDGFKITDVAKHLCKRNDFSQLVGEEFASFFDFSEQPIDAALRSFLTKFSLTGESQERERVLFHFSRRYVSCNPGVFVSEDACHTLVCALMLLNTDLHNQNIPRKMTSQEFVTNLMELNHGANGYCREELRRLYTAIKQDPLRWPQVENPAFNMVSLYGAAAPPPSPALLPSSVSFAYNGATGTLIYPAPNPAATPNGLPQQQQPSSPQFWTDPNAAALAAWTASAAAAAAAPGVVGANRTAAALPLSNHLFSANAAALGAGGGGGGGPFPGLDSELGRRLFQSTGYSPFVDLPKDITAKEYMRGFVMRKWVMESHGKKTSLGKRGWKAFYARLRDLVLYLYKDADTAAAATRAEEMHLAYLQQVYRVYYHYQQQQMQLRYQQERYQQQQLQQQQQHHQQQQSSEAGEVSAAAAANKRPTCLPLDSFPDEQQTPLDSCDVSTADSEPPVLVNGPVSMTTAAATPTDATDLDEAAGRDREVDEEVPRPAELAGTTPPTPTTISSNSTTATTTAAVKSNKLLDVETNATVESSSSSTTTVAAAVQQQPPLPPPINSYVFTVPPPPPAPPPPEGVICIAHAFASPADDYTKKQHVFRLRTKDGAEFLFQVNDAKEVDFWVDKVNYVAGLLSAPALPSAVGSGKGFNRPLLPSGVTPLSLHEQLEEHQKRVIDLTQDLAELRRRKLSAPSQPNLSFYSRDFGIGSAKEAPASPKLAPAAAALPPSSATPGVSARTAHDQSAVTDAQPMSDQDSTGSPLPASPSPFIPDSVLKSLQSPSGATAAASTLPSSATNSSLSSAFSTASLGRRRKIFSGAVSSLMGGGEMSLAAQQRAEYEERVSYLESELTRYKTYSRLLEAELFRLQRMPPSFAQQLYAHSSPQFLPAAFPPTPPGHLMGAPQAFFQPRWVSPPVGPGVGGPGGTSSQQPIPPDLVEEPLSPTEAAADSGEPSTDDQKPAVPMVTATYYTPPPPPPPSAPLGGKRSYGPSASSPYVSLRQGSGSRLHRYRQLQFRHQRQQQQQYLNALAALKSSSPALQHASQQQQQQQMFLSPHQVQSQRMLVLPPSATSSLVSEEVSISDSEPPSPPPSQTSLYEVL